jgi:hypothetical protein
MTRELNQRIRHLEIPDRMRHLPINDQGFPVPYFVPYVDGLPEFRGFDGEKMAICVRHKRCWLCGEPLGKFMVFVIGPMCAVNRVSAEPPSHRDCAAYAVRACPFLTQPKMRRNEKDMPEDRIEPAGVGLLRNPGCAVVWVTREFSTFVASGGNAGHLIELGPPTEVLWFIEGRMAMRDEALAAMERGIPALREMCAQEATPTQREQARKQLEQQYAAAQGLVPGGATSREAG